MPEQAIKDPLAPKDYPYSAPIAIEQAAALYAHIAAAGLTADNITIDAVAGGYQVRADEHATDVVKTALAGNALDDRVLEARKAERLASLADLHSAKLEAGFETDMPAGGKAAFQTRPGDIQNWLTAKALYQDAIAAGQGDTEGAHMRDAADKVHVLKFDQAHAILAAMAIHGAALMLVSWAHKDAIKAALNAAELDAIDIEAGWPV